MLKNPQSRWVAFDIAQHFFGHNSKEYNKHVIIIIIIIITHFCGNIIHVAIGKSHESLYFLKATKQDGP